MPSIIAKPKNRSAITGQSVGRHRLAVRGLGVPIAFPAVALDRFVTAAILESDAFLQCASAY
jgi:hypothetical protein